MGKRTVPEHISKLNLMDGSDKRTELLERMTKRNEEFAPIISEMQDTNTLYEAQKAKEKAEAQKKAEEDAITARKNQEIQTRKNTFLSALRDVENLEYQSSDAESLVQNAINKLSLVETYEEAASYKERLQKAIDRIAPADRKWRAARQAEEEAKAASQAADQQQIGLEQQSLRSYLNQANEAGTPGLPSHPQHRRPVRDLLPVPLHSRHPQHQQQEGTTK